MYKQSIISFPIQLGALFNYSCQAKACLEFCKVKGFVFVTKAGGAIVIP